MRRACLVGVRNEQCTLGWAVVVQHMHDLHRRVRLACTRRANDHRQPWLHASPDRLHLPRPTLAQHCFQQVPRPTEPAQRSLSAACDP